MGSNLILLMKLTLQFTTFSVLVFAASVSSDWTCDDCARASKALATFSVDPEAINAMVDVLIPEICPTSPDPDTCLMEMPRFWDAIAKVIFPEHWSHICEDLEECDTRVDSGIPNCPECAARVNAITNSLSMNFVIERYIKLVRESPSVCETLYPENFAECQNAVAELLPLALPILANQPRNWPNIFCEGWGCKPWDYMTTTTVSQIQG